MAFSEEYRSPRLRDIGLALLIALIALVALFQVGDLVKLTGAALYWLPARLGLLRQAGASEVWRYNLTTMPEVISFPAAGRYSIYTADYDLLVVTRALGDAESPPWLVVTRANTGERAPERFVTRGLRPYDSHLAPGRPVFFVEISQPGRYELKAPRRQAEISIVRDFVTGNERRIVAVFTVELLLLSVPVAWIYGRPYLRRRRRLQAMRLARRAEADAVFQRMQEKRRSQSEADDPHALFKPKD